MVTIETLSVVTNAVIQRAGKGKTRDMKTKVRKIHATLKKLVRKEGKDSKDIMNSQIGSGGGKKRNNRGKVETINFTYTFILKGNYKPFVH